MAQTLEQIKTKAYICLDEFYPDNPLSSQIEGFRIDAFVEDAVRYVGQTAPIRALGSGTDFKSNKEEENVVTLPDNFVRLIAFQMSDWALPVIDALYSDDARYMQQADPVLKGSPRRPIVFICDGGTTIEYYSSASSEIKKAKAFCVEKKDTYYPDRLAEVIAWKTTELVLSALNNTQAIPFAQAQLKQLFDSL